MKLLLFILCIIILLLMGFRIFLISELDSDIPEYIRLQETTATIRRENRILKEKLLQEEAFTTIYEKAKKAGFSKASYLLLR